MADYNFEIHIEFKKKIDLASARGIIKNTFQASFFKDSLFAFKYPHPKKGQNLYEYYDKFFVENYIGNEYNFNAWFWIDYFADKNGKCKYCTLNAFNHPARPIVEEQVETFISALKESLLKADGYKRILYTFDTVYSTKDLFKNIDNEYKPELYKEDLGIISIF